MNSFSTWLTGLMFAIFAVMVLVSLQYPPGARFMPLIVGIPGLLLCALQLALDFAKARRSRSLDRFRAAPKAGKPEAAAELPEFGQHTRGREILMWIYFVAFVGSVVLFGFYITVPIGITLFLWTQAGARLPVAAGAGAAATLVLFLMFGELLQIRLHPGLVAPHIARAVGL